MSLSFSKVLTFVFLCQPHGIPTSFLLTSSQAKEVHFRPCICICICICICVFVSTSRNSNLLPVDIIAKAKEVHFRPLHRQLRRDPVKGSAFVFTGFASVY